MNKFSLVANGRSLAPHTTKILYASFDSLFYLSCWVSQIFLLEDGVGVENHGFLCEPSSNKKWFEFSFKVSLSSGIHTLVTFTFFKHKFTLLINPQIHCVNIPQCKQIMGGQYY